MTMTVEPKNGWSLSESPGPAAYDTVQNITPVLRPVRSASIGRAARRTDTWLTPGSSSPGAGHYDAVSSWKRTSSYGGTRSARVTSPQRRNINVLGGGYAAVDLMSPRERAAWEPNRAAPEDCYPGPVSYDTSRNGAMSPRFAPMMRTVSPRRHVFLHGDLVCQDVRCFRGNDPVTPRSGGAPIPKDLSPRRAASAGNLGQRRSAQQRSPENPIGSEHADALHDHQQAHQSAAQYDQQRPHVQSRGSDPDFQNFTGRFSNASAQHQPQPTQPWDVGLDSPVAGSQRNSAIRYAPQRPHAHEPEPEHDLHSAQGMGPQRQSLGAQLMMALEPDEFQEDRRRSRDQSAKERRGMPEIPNFDQLRTPEAEHQNGGRNRARTSADNSSPKTLESANFDQKLMHSAYTALQRARGDEHLHNGTRQESVRTSIPQNQEPDFSAQYTADPQPAPPFEQSPEQLQRKGSLGSNRKSIRRQTTGGQNASWQVKVEDRWQDIGADACRVLQDALEQNLQTVQLTCGVVKYDVDMESMTQTNVRTKKVRQMRRRTFIAE